MFDRRISVHQASALDPADAVKAIHSLLGTLTDFAAAGKAVIAPQHDVSAPPAPSLAARYAAANPITRRRFDAILRETDTVARTGLALIMGRDGQQDAATAAAARFLGKNVAASLNRLENLLTLPAA